MLPQNHDSTQPSHPIQTKIKGISTIVIRTRYSGFTKLNDQAPEHLGTNSVISLQPPLLVLRSSAIGGDCNTASPGSSRRFGLVAFTTQRVGLDSVPPCSSIMLPLNMLVQITAHDRDHPDSCVTRHCHRFASIHGIASPANLLATQVTRRCDDKLPGRFTFVLRSALDGVISLR